MVNILYVTLTVGFIILAGLLLWLLSYVLVERKEPEDAPIAINFLSHFDGGHFLGIETDSKAAKDGRHFIKILPKDLHPKKMGEDIEEVSVIVGRNKICSYPKGTISKDRNIKVYLPNHPDDLHEAVKDSILGRGIMMAIELQNAANAEIESLLKGHERKDEILKRIGHAELSKEFVSLMEEQYQDILKFQLDAKSKDKVPTFNPNVSMPFARKDG